MKNKKGERKTIKDMLCKLLTVFLLPALILSGCGNNQAVTDKAVVSEKVSVDEKTLHMLDEPEILYEPVSMKPSIYVDLVGYVPNGEKVAVIEAGIIPRRFEIVDVKTGKSVYSGYVHERECPEDDETLSAIVDFSDFTAEGTYYISADFIGRSENFDIRSGIYEDLLKANFGGLYGLRDVTDKSDILSFESNADVTLDVSGGWITGEGRLKDVCEGCLAMQDLMLCIEYYPKAFSDDYGTETSGNKIPDILDEVMFEAEWLLKMQNPETGGVYTSVSVVGNEKGEQKRVIMGETTRATAYFCSSMAKLSYVVKKYDGSFSTKCIEAANLAWKCLEANKDLVDKTQMFRAAVEMYRATGYKVYSRIIDDYLKDNANKEYTERIALDGAITYMATTRSTNKQYCTQLMEQYMERTENKSNASKESRYLVESGDREEAVLLRNLSEILIVNYIISNKEYGTIEENYLHYFCGRNPENKICDSLKNSPDAYAQLMFLLGKLTLMSSK
ncbi:MAG: glycoside hydrolase family 9 protein [Lachnospiraceae bacterium]|nr:glycoside hydrolase family 9 protein [Lachnospiraceae bacterium]